MPPTLDNPDDQTRKLLQDEQAYTEKPEESFELAAEIWSGISARVDESGTFNAGAPEAAETVDERRPTRHHWLPWLLAASFAGLVAGMLWLDHSGRTSSSQPPPKVANLLVRQDLDRVNQTDRRQTVYLVDGSKVILQPGAGIRHAAFMQKDKREVYLQGNAFFEVAKDAHRPFYVYSGNVIVRVLGTSFKVATDKVNGDITVLVTTGKVAVTKRTAPLPEPLILTTNQIALYKGQSQDLVQLKAEKKDLAPDLIPAAPSINFNFDETPVTEIFSTLENAFGIPFHYDSAAFARYKVTTTLGDEPLEQKVRIICEAIGATYQLKDDGVYLEIKPAK